MRRALQFRDPSPSTRLRMTATSRALNSANRSLKSDDPAEKPTVLVINRHTCRAFAFATCAARTWRCIRVRSIASSPAPSAKLPRAKTRSSMQR